MEDSLRAALKGCKVGVPDDIVVDVDEATVEESFALELNVFVESLVVVVVVEEVRDVGVCCDCSL